MDVDLVSIPQMLKNGCSVSAVGRIMLIRDKNKKIVFKAVRHKSGLYVAHEKDALSYIASMEEEEGLEDLWKTNGTYTPAVKGVAAGLKGVPNRDWISRLRETLSPGNFDKLQKMIETDQEEQYSFENMKPGMSEPDFVNFIEGHYTMQERKRAKEAWEVHSTTGHMSQKQLGDALENGVYAGSYLTRADVDRAYKLFKGCNAYAEAKFKLPPEPESNTPPAPSVGHTLNMDIFSIDIRRWEVILAW